MSQITWGDTVRIKGSASTEKRPGAFASVCGILTVETAQHAMAVNCPIGTTVYLIEFPDGSDIQVSVDWLEKVEDNG